MICGFRSFTKNMYQRIGSMSDVQFNICDYKDYRECPGQYRDSYIRNSGAVKISESENEVVVAVSFGRCREVKTFLIGFHAPKEVRFIIVEDSDFAEFIGSIVDSDSSGPSFSTSDVGNQFGLEEVSDSAPVINIINAICLSAIRRNASDIHIQPEKDALRVRFRMDGVLKVVKVMDAGLSESIASRIKVMSNLNILEQRLPQDGRMRVTLGDRSLDFRVSFIPVAYGESIVLRIFNTKKEIQHLADLGFSSASHDMLQKALGIPNGLILATGPTGSGKTTTLHALISGMDSEALKIITIEDPVERIIPGVDQIQVNDSIGLTFDSILRRILRQDPDVIMVGEIRDSATAELAIRAALTGHLILSTLHTNDSISAVTRLRNMGVEPYLVSSVLKYSIAQRLVRKICPFCSVAVPLNAEMKILRNRYNLSGDAMKISKGCERCGLTGYSGRTVVSEIFELTDACASCIDEEHPVAELYEIAERNNMKSLSYDAVQKVLSGETTYYEIHREALA